MNCIIIEDQPPAQRILKKYIEDVGSLHLLAVYSDALQALEFLKTTTVDLIFLDIHLPKISGIDFLKSLTHSPYVILTTAFPDYALASYEFSVTDYLLKPFSFQRFVQAVNKVPVHQASATVLSEETVASREIFIKSGHAHIKITIAEIGYIKSDADYTEIFLPNKRYLSAEPLRYWLENLDPSQFVQIHKSHIVNTTKIEQVVGNRVYLPNGVQLPIGRAYKDFFIQNFVRGFGKS